VHHRLKPIANALGAGLLLATLGAVSVAAEAGDNSLRRITVEPAAWNGPPRTAQLGPPPAPNATLPQMNPAPSEIVTPSSTPKQYESPLLDGKLPAEELLPPVVKEGSSGEGEHQPVQPYGGGHPTDWSWGCGGNPYRTGPGLCDNYKIGPRWHVTVDGLVMHREQTDLTALVAQMRADNTFMSGDGTAVGGGTDMPPESENFHYAPGGRVTFTSQISRCAGYDVQAVYEGINDWNADVVFPKEALPPFALVIPPSPNTEPGAPFPEGFQQRSLHYRSNFNSGELNFLTNCDPEFRPFFGVRFIRFDDEINDSLNQERQIPLPGPQTGVTVPGTIAGVSDPIGPTFETDRFNILHLQNNLMGFQIGLLHDTIQLNERFALEGFVSGGVYYNQVKYSNVMGIFTTQTFADNTRSAAINDARTDTSNIVNNDARDLAEISYATEASLTGVCRLNRCWALRGGYEMLYITNLHTADVAFLGFADQSQNLFFHGWHAGIECRR
jgi:hypothetical protein